MGGGGSPRISTGKLFFRGSEIIITHILVAVDEVFFKQGPILKQNLPVEILGEPPPPKGDPMFELKPLPDTLKYAYLDEKKIYPVIISANLSEKEEENY